MQALRTRPGTRRGGIVYLRTGDIYPNPVQPRKQFDSGALEELSLSIKNYGILNPLTVRCRGGGAPPARGEACGAGGSPVHPHRREHGGRKPHRAH